MNRFRHQLLTRLGSAVYLGLFGVITFVSGCGGETSKKQTTDEKPKSNRRVAQSNDRSPARNDSDSERTDRRDTDVSTDASTQHGTQTARTDRTPERRDNVAPRDVGERVEDIAELMLAARAGDVEAIGKLAARGADLSIRDDRGRTILHDSAEAGRIGIVEALVSVGADLNARDNDHVAPIHLALQNG